MPATPLHAGPVQAVARLLALLDIAVEGVLFVNARREVEVMNDKFRRAFDIALGDHPDSAGIQHCVVAAMEEPAKFRAMLRAWSHQGHEPVEAELRLKKGLVLLTTFKEVRAADGTREGWLWQFVDVTEIRAREEALRMERRLTHQLLHAILPAEIVPSMLRDGRVEPMLARGVAVCFVDFVGFTRLTQHMDETKLIAELDHFFGHFDEIVDHYGLEKIKTIGDAYLFVAGVPIALPDACARALLAAIDIQALLKNEKPLHGGVTWEARIGIHVGDVIAGIIGKTKFSYDIWGDTVNVASRIEGHCQPGGIAISHAVHELVKADFQCSHRGMVIAKNHDEVDIFDVHGAVNRRGLMARLRADRSVPFSRKSQESVAIAAAEGLEG